MPPGGLGNLIALPLQGRALQEGNSVFVDEHWKAYGDQWEVLRTVLKISKEFIEKKTEEWSSQGILGILSDVSCEEDTKMENTPWKQETAMYPEDVDGSVAIIESNGLFIDTSNLKNRIQNRMRRLAAFSNPEYYKKPVSYTHLKFYKKERQKSNGNSLYKFMAEQTAFTEQQDTDAIYGSVVHIY